MDADIRSAIRSAFDREIGSPPAGAEARVLGGFAERAESRHGGRHAAAIAAVLVAVALVALLLSARGLTQSRRPAPASPVPASPSTPSARSNAAVAFDSAHSRLVVFGGNTGQPNGLLGDTWTWSGGAWTAMSPAQAPSPRSDARTADDPNLGVVLFGGATSSGYQRDTWVWDGRTWHSVATIGGPPPESGVALAYDPASHSVIGYGYQPPQGGETWRLTPTGWQRLQLTVAPALGQPVLGWDGHRLILVGMPFGPEQGQYRTQTWSWDGTGWSRLAPAVDLPEGFAVGGYSATEGRLVVLINSETWSWDGRNWARLHPSVQPELGYGGSAATDSSGHLLIFGGQAKTTPGNELWQWDGQTWRRLSGSPASVTTQPVGRPTPVAMPADQVAQAVATGTTGIDPRLVPTYVPAGMTATVTTGAGELSIHYTDDTHQRTITFAAVIANPPPGDANTRNTTLTFRGQQASYQVYDVTAPLSQRYLMWVEPGTWVGSLSKQPGVYYFASSSGITEAEFFKLLQSLQTV